MGDVMIYFQTEDFKRLLSKVGNKHNNRNWVDLMLKAISKVFVAEKDLTNFKITLKDYLLQEHPNFIHTVSCQPIL